MTGGVRLALYRKKALAEDISKDVRLSTRGFGGITRAHNVSRKKEVAEVLALAEKAVAKLVKPAQDTFWGGYGGYFADLDGYYWEVAWVPMCTFSWGWQGAGAEVTIARMLKRTGRESPPAAIGR